MYIQIKHSLRERVKGGKNSQKQKQVSIVIHQEGRREKEGGRVGPGLGPGGREGGREREKEGGRERQRENEGGDERII